MGAILSGLIVAVFTLGFIMNDSPSSDPNMDWCRNSTDENRVFDCDDCDCSGCDATFGHGPRCY